MRETINCYNGLRILIDHFVKPDMVCAEIGSFSGESSIMFAAKCQKLFCIDPWSEDINKGDYGGAESTSIVEAKFDSLTLPFKNIVKIKKTSDEAVNDIEDNSIDFLYIDGLHTFEQVKKDIENYFPKVKKNGIIAGHDYNPFAWIGVYQSVRFSLGEPHLVFPDTSWLFFKEHFQNLTNFFVELRNELPFMHQFNLDEKGKKINYQEVKLF